MTYPGIRRNDQRKTLDRETWAGFDRVIYNMVLEGAGEYLLEDPLYFGRVYDRPPFFTYSAVRNLDLALEDVRSVGFPHPQVDNDIAAGSNCLWQDHYFPDGSFEHQMIWSDSVIPTWGQTTWSNFQKIEVEQSGSYTYPRIPQYANGWIQEPKNVLWAVSNERAFQDVPGHKGSHSAKYTFGADPVTPWLMPIYPPYDNDQPYDTFGLTDATRWKACWSHAIQINPDIYGDPIYDEWLFQSPAYNPKQGEHKYIVHAWSDGPATLEMDVLWWGTDTASRWDWGGTSETRQVVPDGWNELEFTTRLPEYLYPNYPNLNQQEAYAFDAQFGGASFEENFATVRFRVTGTSQGQKVYLDEIWGMPRLRPTIAPMITIGVAEWVQDDRDMYIGAKLWFRIDTEGELFSPQ